MSLEQLKAKIPAYAKDIKLNLSTLLSGTETVQLTKTQIVATALAVAYATQQKTVIQHLVQHAQIEGLTEEAITAIKAATSIMAMNNVYYSTIERIKEPGYVTLPSNLRMHILQNHGIAQQDFELYALAVSAANGCGRCVNAHLNVLVKGGLGKNEIQYSIRLAAVIKAVAQVMTIEENVNI
jgi:alkyl hydroperoxide reductase subunit D